MTENERMSISGLLDVLNTGIALNTCHMKYAIQSNVLEDLILYLEEIQQYRVIGTVEEIKTSIKYMQIAKMHGTVGKAIDACAEYEAIGTIEEFKALKEKNEPKKPKHYGDSEDGKLECPNCEEDLWELIECGFSNCPYCGQKLDWSE